MEQFPDGAHVRLRSRVLGTYIRADVDRVGISLSPYRGSINAAWTVHRVVRDGVAYIVFHGAAYGRYIALCPDVTGQRIVQHICDTAEDDVDILWLVMKARDGGATSVLLRHGAHHTYLVAGMGDESRSRQWLVEMIPQETSALRSPTLPASDADAAAVVPALDFFPDGAHLRLRRPTDGQYMFADEDGVAVSMSPHRATLNTVWTVHQVQRHGTTYVLLQSAAYGRYLAYSAGEEKPPATRLLVQNRYYHDETQIDILWQVYRAPGETSGSTMMLRQGRHGPRCRAWDIEFVPLRARPPHLPDPSHKVVQNRIVRNILYIVGDDYGNYSQRGWKNIKFEGCSVYQLRDRLADELGEEHSVRIVLSVWSGYLGRLTPLVVDLPSNDYTIKIIVYVSWSRAGLALRHPNVDALPSSENPLDIVVLPNSSPAAMGLRHPNVHAPEPAPGI